MSRLLLVVVRAFGAGACTGDPHTVGSEGDPEGWACARNRIAQATFTLDPSASGYGTRDAAFLAAADLLADDGVADREALSEAAAAATSGHLLIQGQIVADVTLTSLDDGSWSIASMLYCSAPPTGGSPGTTPG